MEDRDSGQFGSNEDGGMLQVDTRHSTNQFTDAGHRSTFRWKPCTTAGIRTQSRLLLDFPLFAATQTLNRIRATTPLRPWREWGRIRWLGYDSELTSSIEALPNGAAILICPARSI